MARKDPTTAPRRRRFGPRLGMLTVALAVIGVSVVVRYHWGARHATAGDENGQEGPRADEEPRDGGQPGRQQPQVAAVVNNEEISRNELAVACLRIYGVEVLENLVNKRLILDHCKAQNIKVTKAEVQEEIERMAGRFGIATDRWLSMLQEERGINPAMYANDVVWPTLALRKLAASRLAATAEELDMAYEAKYGPAVRVRLIACESEEKARRAHEEAVAAPDEFPALAKQYSDDPNIASAKGLVQPIRMHVGEKSIEQAAFAMRVGEVSEVIGVGHQYVILKCEGHVAARDIPKEQVAEALAAEIRESKEQAAAAEVFQGLQEKAQIQNVFNDEARSREMPGVAAVVNGHKITLGALGEACIERHGEEVLAGLITRRIVAQACKKETIVVTRGDIDEEIARAATAAQSLEEAAQGGPDIKKWLQTVTKEQGIAQEVYVNEVVWPSVAMKKLVGDSVEVTDEDLQKGFEANYGPRVRCLAIVLNNQRRAQEVWELARDNPTEEFFGDLAEQYSSEAQSRTLRGQVPPIQRHGGQPILEEEAFTLERGELSGVVQVGENFVILFCLGRTTPRSIEFDEVRDLLYEDIHEKKLRVAMARHLDALEEAAQIDNILAGTVQTPKRVVERPASGASNPGESRRR